MFGSKEIKYTDVFVPGGVPTYTYNPRTSKNIEERLRESTENYKLTVVTGPTKSGKTVLVNKIFPRSENIWIDGGTINSEDGFWEWIVSCLGGYTEEEISNGDDLQYSIEGTGKAEGKLFLVNTEAGFSSTIGNTEKTSMLQRRKMSNKGKAISLLQETKIPIIVDDFHYIDKEIQKRIVRALKAPIMYGVPVICIAIPSRKFDVIDVERELTGRMDSIDMPVWDINELEKIAIDGFTTLNCKIPEDTIRTFAAEAFGSPFLMQEFCRSACKIYGISTATKYVKEYNDIIDQRVIFAKIANNSGRSMFDKLKRGPRARTDRKPRKMKSGQTLDIYGVVMEALKHAKPGIETISYDTLRANIRDVIDEDLPQRHEVSRVLEQIADISYTDSSSTPVIDWQKDDNILTITDPFFAFFLKWSSN